MNQKKKTDNVEISRLTLRESDDILFEILDSWQDGKKISLVSDMELVEYVATTLLKDVEDITAEYIDFTAEIDEEEYLSILRDLLASKRKSIHAADDYELNGKLMRFAMSRGFELKDIKRCIDIPDEEEQID